MNAGGEPHDKYQRCNGWNECANPPPTPTSAFDRLAVHVPSGSNALIFLSGNSRIWILHRLAAQFLTYRTNGQVTPNGACGNRGYTGDDGHQQIRMRAWAGAGPDCRDRGFELTPELQIVAVEVFHLRLPSDICPRS